MTMNGEMLYNMGLFILWVTVELSIILVMAMIVAELILEYVDLGKVAKILSARGRIAGMLLAVFFGLVTPFCACATIPVIAGMNKTKLSFSVTMAFLFASPVLSFSILGGIAAVFSPEAAVLYLLTTGLAALLIGVFMETAGMSKYVKRVRVEGGMQQSDNRGATPWQTFVLRFKAATGRGLRASKIVIPYIIIGACVGAVVMTFFTEDLALKYLGPQNLFAVPVAVAIGIPLNIDPAATLTLCVAFYAKGASIGTILGFFIGTIGVSVPMIVMLSSIYERKFIITYVGLLFLMITAIGYFFNVIGG